MTLATGCVLAIARELAMQGKPALNRCTARMSCRYVQMRNENERQPAWVASTSISLRCILHTYLYIYIYIYLCIAFISSHSKGPEQEQLRSPFVPYVRNTAERSIHNFDSQPNVLRATATCNFSSLIWPDGSAPAAVGAYFSTRSHKSLEKHSV